MKVLKRGNIQAEDVKECSVEMSQMLEQYENTRSASVKGFVESSLLITTRFADVPQLHRIKHPMGCRSQLTFYPEPIQSATVCPQHSTRVVAFLKDQCGNEFNQIYAMNLNSGQAILLTDGGLTKNGNVKWSPTGRSIAYSSTLGNNTDHHVVIVNLLDSNEKIENLFDSLASNGVSAFNSLERRNLVTDKGSWSPIDWSKDEKLLLVRHYRSANDSQIYVTNVSNGQKWPLLLPEEAQSDTFACLSARFGDSNTIYFTSDDMSEFRQLFRLKVSESGEPIRGSRRSLSENIPWNVTSIVSASSGEFAVFCVNEHGSSQLYRLDAATETNEKIAFMSGVISNYCLNQQDDHLAVSISTASSPGNVYVIDLTTLEIVQWTESEVGGLAATSFIQPNLFQYETFDMNGSEKRKIPCFVYKPKPQTEKFPVLIHIHGGPEGQSRPSFKPIYQFFLAKLRVAILDPNVRGSNGYGKNYLLLDNGKKREDSVKDIGSLLDWIATQPDLDANRVIVWGGSYGGYMVLASMIHYGDRLLAGMESVGISNFVTFLQNTQPYRQDLRRVEYGDERDPSMREFLLSISPTTHADRITKPMLIAQGLHDPRVPVTESEQIRDAIRANGHSVWYIVADNEGHGFRKKSNKDFLYRAMTMFLSENF